MATYSEYVVNNIMVSLLLQTCVIDLVTTWSITTVVLSGSVEPSAGAKTLGAVPTANVG